MTDNHWTSMFEQPGRGTGRAPVGVPPAASLGREEPNPDDIVLDMTEYRPWVLQRVRSRPAMMLHLRRYEPKSGLWMGWAVSYAHLAAVEYIGDRMLSLDLGARQFVVRGEGLTGIVEPLQAGTVLALQEYSASIWPSRSAGPTITSINRLGQDGPPQ